MFDELVNDTERIALRESVLISEFAESACTDITFFYKDVEVLTWLLS